MPLTTQHCYNTLRRLDDEWERLNRLYQKWSPLPNTIPAGGGDFIDYFFRMEAIRGAQSVLRSTKQIKAAIDEGKRCARAAILIWNSRRKKEYQIHRWDESCHEFIERLVWRLVRECRPVPSTDPVNPHPSADQQTMGTGMV